MSAAVRKPAGLEAVNSEVAGNIDSRFNNRIAGSSALFVNGSTNDRRQELVEQQMPTIFYAVPLSLAVSMAYCASRYELPERIFRSAAAMFVKILLGLLVLYGVLWFFSS
ncbi:MAG: hypothetical protein R3C19_11170 [Planctomycetaceae bacterium]